MTESKNRMFVTGIVERTNEKGIKLKDEESWRNWSKYAIEPWRPNVGETVTLNTDSAGFIRQANIANGTQRDGMAGHAKPIPPTAQPNNPARTERSIVLQTVIKATAQVLSAAEAGKDLTFDEVADAVLQWYDANQYPDVAALVKEKHNLIEPDTEDNEIPF